MATASVSRLGHRSLLLREALASGLYVALVLVGAVIAVPASALPQGLEMALLVLGTAGGLVLAHWYAFRLASHLAEGGQRSQGAAQEGLAQLVGGMAVAGVAAAPYLLLGEEAARETSLILLLAMPGLTGALVMRARGGAWISTVAYSATVTAIAVAIVIVKDRLSH